MQCINLTVVFDWMICVVFDWITCHIEQFESQVKLGFDVVTGTQTVIIQRSPGSIFDFT